MSKSKIVVSDSNAAQGAIIMLSVEQLRPQKNHPFKLYVGEKSERMVQSIKVNGIVQPIIVRLIEGSSDEFEIISGHNRVEAAKKAGLLEIPAVIRELSDDAATILANETNLIQRSIENWLPSELAKSIAQYHESIKRQGERPTGDAPDTSGELNQTWNSRKETAKVYSISENIARTYLSLSKLIDPLLDRLDENKFGITPATNLSKIPRKVQGFINSILDEGDDEVRYEITMANSKELKTSFGNVNADCLEENQTKELIRFILTPNNVGPQENLKSDKLITFSIPAETYIRLFQNEKNITRVVEMITTWKDCYKEHTA